jgi:hypothetical protein
MRTRKAAVSASLKQAPAAVPPVIHILIRVRSEDGRTISAHQKIVGEKGKAVFGKIGQPLSSGMVNTLNEQIGQGARTLLFLTTREGWNGPYVTYQCGLKHVYERLDETTRPLVPKYYIFEEAKIGTWLEILSIQRMSRDEMNRIFVLSSGREIMSVIKSSATVFRVGVREGTALPTSTPVRPRKSLRPKLPAAR